MTNLSVLLTVDAVGGVWQYGVELARALLESGVRPVLAVLGPEPSAAQRAEAAGIELIETDLPLDWLCDGPAAVLAAGAAIAALARKTGVDLVQLNSPALAAAPQPVPTLAVAHGCVSTWWQAARPHDPLPDDWRWHRSLMGEGLRAAGLVVAPSASYARLLARHYGLRRTPTAVHNGRRPLVQRGGPAMHDCVLTVGRMWDQVKQAELLDGVAARLAVPFHAAGPTTGPHGETVKLEHLHALGRVGEVELAKRLAARPVFVSAASFEPFGLAVLEAAQAGCALVLSDIPTFRELWGDAASFVPVRDEAAYAEAIEALIGDQDRRLRLGAAARERAARYTPAATATAMIGLYHQLLQGDAVRRVA